MTDHSHDSWKPASNPWAVAIVVTLAVFMEILDTTIVNVALPHVAGSLSSSYDESTWVLTSYLVANGIVLPISAFLSRVFGRKQFFLICIVMFTVCSFLCGIATELWQIILFRVMQGFLAAVYSPRSSRYCSTTSSRRTGAKPLGSRPSRLSLHRSSARRWGLDHRQLLLALGVLYQHPGGDCHGAGDLPAAGRSAVGE